MRDLVLGLRLACPIGSVGTHCQASDIGMSCGLQATILGRGVASKHAALKRYPLAVTIIIYF